ncbi:hypothetical protein BLOT_002192 [Blomia tropicalis]|nr:hypothetical protein BLOT_002192 [Blomia tropicalis]
MAPNVITSIVSNDNNRITITIETKLIEKKLKGRYYWSQKFSTIKEKEINLMIKQHFLCWIPQKMSTTFSSGCHRLEKMNEMSGIVTL